MTSALSGIRFGNGCAVGSGVNGTIFGAENLLRGHFADRSIGKQRRYARLISCDLCFIYR